MERSRNPGEHTASTVEARTAWPVGISQAHTWRGRQGDCLDMASMEECPKGNGGIITRMNEHHMMGNKKNKEVVSDKGNVSCTVVKKSHCRQLCG